MTVSHKTVDLISPSIFRAYDIRGIVGETLFEDTINIIGKAIGTLTLKQGEKRMVVARDGRLSGPTLKEALITGIRSTGCGVIDVGVVPTPLLYYSTFVLGTKSGVMLTGSHNPANYNGLKTVINGETLSEKTITDLYQRIMQREFVEGEGELDELEVIERYVTHVTHDVALKRSLKVVIDCGNGVAGKVAPELFRRLGCEVIELFCDVDGNFPNHHPDPSQAENLEDLIHHVKHYQADVGLAFDGDGDRLGVVTSNGEIIWPDRQLMLFAKSILAKKSGEKIIYDVKCSNHLEDVIRASGGEPIMWKTGHSLIKAKLAETHAALAGEMSGHLFFKDRWYGFDDALYAGARLLEILSEFAGNSSELFDTIPNSINTPELKLYVTDAEKFDLMQQLIDKADFDKKTKVTTIDGLRVDFGNGWGLVRPSNTTPCLVFRFEAETEAHLKNIQNKFKDLLLSVNSSFKLPF